MIQPSAGFFLLRLFAFELRHSIGDVFHLRILCADGSSVASGLYGVARASTARFRASLSSCLVTG